MHYAFQGCIDVHVTPEKGRLDFTLCLCTRGELGALPIHRLCHGSKVHAQSLGTAPHTVQCPWVSPAGPQSQQVHQTPLGLAPAPVLGWHHYPWLSMQGLSLLLLLFVQQCQTCRNAKVCSCIYCKSYCMFITRWCRLVLICSRSMQAAAAAWRAGAREMKLVTHSQSCLPRWESTCRIIFFAAKRTLSSAEIRDCEAGMLCWSGCRAPCVTCVLHPPWLVSWDSPWLNRHCKCGGWNQREQICFVLFCF